jgi:hypothetical protein
MAASEDDLRAALEQRFKGDGSGACIAAAVIEDGTTVQADFCAHAKSARSLDERTAFEIGSITKTVTAHCSPRLLGWAKSPSSSTPRCSRGAKSTVRTLSLGMHLVVVSRLSASEPL